MNALAGRSQAAAFALARIAVVRRARRLDALVNLGLAWLAVLIGGASYLFLAVLGHTRIQGFWGSLLILACFWVAPGLVLGLPLAFRGVWQLLRLFGRIPGGLAAVALAPIERAAVRHLLTTGLITRSWLDASRLRRLVAQRLLEDDLGLVDTPEGVRPVGSRDESCPTCGGGLVRPGAGILTCASCGYGRFEPLPPPAARLRALRLRVQHGLWSSLVSAEPWLPRWLRWGGWLLLVNLIGALIMALGPKSVMGVGGMIGLIASFGGVYVLGRCAWAVVHEVLRRIPEQLDFRRQLREEVLALVSTRGGVTLAELEEHLELPRSRFLGPLAMLLATRDLPLYHDAPNERLVSTFLQGLDTRCGPCGGRLTPGPRGLVCEHCGSVALALAPPPEAPIAAAVTEPTVTLSVDESRPAAGGRVHGSVTVALPAAGRCDAVRVRLLRDARGERSDEDAFDVLEECVVLRHQEVMAPVSARFVLPLPVEAVDFKGRLVTVDYWVRARLMPDGPSVDAELQVQPAPDDPVLVARAAASARRARLSVDTSRGAWIAFAVVFIGVPCAAFVVAMAIAGVLALGHGELGPAAGWLGFTALILRGAWEGVKETSTGLRLRLRVGASWRGPTTARFGDVLTGAVVVRGSPAAIRWTLVHQEWSGRQVTTTRRGSKTTTTDWTYRDEERAAGSVQACGGPVTFTVPTAGPASAFWPFRRIRWELRVHLDTPRGTRTIVTPLDVVPVRAP